MPIDTHVDADPASCRTTARWLDGVARAGESSADEVVGARNDSFDCWSGTAGDAFRDQATRIGRAGDTTSAQARIGGQALGDFADAAQAVLDSMGRARAVAAAAGLVVTGETIGDPVAAPAAPPDGVLLPPEQAATFRSATATAAAQLEAYRRADRTVADARVAYTEAQSALVDRLRAPTNEAVRTAKDVMLVVSSITSTFGALHGAAETWAAVAARAAAQRTALLGVMLAPGVPIEEAVRAAERAGQEALGARGASATNAAVLRGVTAGASETSAGRALLTGLTANPGTLVENGALARVAPVLKQVPYVSVAFAVGGGVTDVAAGRSVPSAVAKQATTLGAGAAATWVTTAAVGALVGAGAVAALPVVAGVVVGGLLAYGVGANWDRIESAVDGVFS